MILAPSGFDAGAVGLESNGAKAAGAFPHRVSHRMFWRAFEANGGLLDRSALPSRKISDCAPKRPLTNMGVWTRIAAFSDPQSGCPASIIIQDALPARARVHTS